MEKAGEGNRTLVSSLEGYSFTIKLHPHFRRVSCRAAAFVPSSFCLLVHGLRFRRGASTTRTMKATRYALLIVLASAVITRADLTMVQSVEGVGPVNSMTIKMKGDKARIDASRQVSTIVDSKTGEIVNILHEQKQVMRMSAAQAKAAAAMAMSSMGAQEAAAQKAQLKPTGKKETINGHETEEFTYETPMLTATYWVARNYPDSDAIMKQLQAMTPDAWGAATQGMPDYRDFPGLPIRSRVNINGQQITTTVTSVKMDPLPESDFVVPQGFSEMKMPDLNGLLGGKGAAPKAAPSPKR
jgi:hypothetical protein